MGWQGVAPPFFILDMKKDEKQRVSDALTEKPTYIRVGWKVFKARPLTLAQIYEMGTAACEINADGLNEKENKVRVVAALIDHYNDARIMIEVFLICLFRSHIKRFLWRWYIKHRLKLNTFQELMGYVAQSFDANFFLTSIIFLRQATKMTEPSPTTAPGQWSEE